MSRTFKTVDYEAARDLTVRLGDCLPPDHLACFVVDSVALLDLSALYARYGSRGGEPYAPEVLLALLLYGYATGVFSSRKIERATGRRPRGRPPTAPTPGPRDGDQYNFTDPASRIMKHPTDQGFDQDDNAQIAVDQQSLLLVGTALSNHSNDTHEAEPTLAAIPPEVGTPDAAALDHGYWGPATLEACARRGLEPYIATGREPHHQSWRERFAPLSDPPPEDASPQVKMAYKLKTAEGKAIYGARKFTVEPVLGLITAVLGFRQFSLRGTVAAAGAWLLVCLAFNLKRFHTLSPAY